jgi:hypothetical protein
VWLNWESTSLGGPEFKSQYCKKKLDSQSLSSCIGKSVTNIGA